MTMFVSRLRRSRPSAHSAATRTISSSLAGVSTCRCCAYENGKPASTPDHLSFEWAGAKDGEPVFVAGHPGTTQRLLTMAQLKTQRDVFFPSGSCGFSELRGRMIQALEDVGRSRAHRQGLSQ